MFLNKILVFLIRIIFSTHLNAKLYLVALILGHLFTLSDEITDPEACLHAYVPSLLK